MNRTLRDLLVLGAGMLLGAVALGRAWAQPTNFAAQQQQQVTTTAAARQAPGAPVPGARYQYMCQTKWEARMYDQEIQRRLNELGAQGWHLMPPMIARSPGMGYSDVYCFERAY